MNINTGMTLALLVYSGMLNAEIFKWVDEDGNTHYGDKPVESAEEVQVDIEKKGNLKSSMSREERQKKLMDSFDDDRAREKKEKDKKKQHKQKCHEAKDKLNRLKGADYMYDLDKKGDRVILPEEERLKEIGRWSKSIKKNCR